MNLMTPSILEKLKRQIREDNLQDFYRSKEWRKLKVIARRRDNNECQYCKERGKYKPCRSVHHIQEVKGYPEKALTLSNLVSLCEECHNKTHGKSRHIIKQGEKKKKFQTKERW